MCRCMKYRNEREIDVKKIISIFICIALLGVNAFAVDSDYSQKNYKVISEPETTLTFEYSLKDNKDVYRTDFVFSQMDNKTGIILNWNTKNKEHEINMKIVSTDGEHIVFDDKIQIINGGEIGAKMSMIKEWTYFDNNKEYYIELSKATQNNVSGIFEFEIQGSADISSLLAVELTKMGILNGDHDGDLKFEEKLKRREVAHIITRIMKMTNVEIKNSFSDVSTGIEEYYNIGTVQSLGIMIGDENKLFNPENNITSDELVKVLVCLLGYEPLATQKGGYPDGYIKVANEIGLINSKYIPAIELTTAQSAEMIYTSLSLPLMVQISFGKNAEYAIYDGINYELQTIKSKYLGIKE